MPTKIWAVGEEVLAADFNDYVQEQVVATFPNAAARTAAIAAPIPGMLTYLADVGRLEQYTDKASPVGWYRPWALPWGEVFYADVSQPLTPGPVAIPGTSFTFPALNRRYLCTFHSQAVKDATAGNISFSFQTNLAVGVNATQTVPAGNAWAASLHERYTAATGGVTSVFVIVQAAPGNVTTSWGRFIIADIGPA